MTTRFIFMSMTRREILNERRLVCGIFIDDRCECNTMPSTRVRHNKLAAMGLVWNNGDVFCCRC